MTTYTRIAGKSLDTAVEQFATASDCGRHIPQIRMCKYNGGEPCKCRTLAEQVFEAGAVFGAAHESKKWSHGRIDDN